MAGRGLVRAVFLCAVLVGSVSSIAAAATRRYVAGLLPGVSYYIYRDGDLLQSGVPASSSGAIAFEADGPAYFEVIPPGFVDQVSPGSVTDLAIQAATEASITLTWTAPGDDGAHGKCRTYDLRLSGASITELNYATTTPVDGEGAPQVTGSRESYTSSGLQAGTTYHFALRAADEAGRWSSVSNDVVGVTTGGAPPDVRIPPAAVTDLATGTVSDSSVVLTWTAPGDDGNNGRATVYDVRYSTGAITPQNLLSAAAANGEPPPGPAGTAESFTVRGLQAGTTYCFALRTADETLLWSPASNVVNARTADWGVRWLGMVPNPSSGSVALLYMRDEPGPARLTLFDVSGRLLGRIEREEGGGRQVWMLTGLREVSDQEAMQGVYFLRLEAGRLDHRDRLVILRQP